MISTKKCITSLLIITFILSGCSGLFPAASEEQPNQGGTLKRAMTSEPAVIDPQGTPSSGLSLVLPYLFDTLVVRDLDNSVQPLLAESWDVAEDGTSITFHLKEGVTFHDGTPLTADAVKFTFERFQEVGTRSPIYGGVMQISGIEVLDDLTVRFDFEQPAPLFWGTISMPYAGIISPASIPTKEQVESGDGHLVGSGPFMLGEWIVGQSITLTKNPDYQWGPPVVDNQGPPYLDEFVYQVIPDASTQLAALKSGEVDIMFINLPSHWTELQNHPEIELQEALMSGLIYLGYNCQKSPLDDILVRQAISHAVNKPEIIDLGVNNMGQEAFVPLPPTLPGYDEDLQEFALDYDPEQAEALLLKAGYERNDQDKWVRDGEELRLVLLTSTRDPNGKIATLIQSHLKQIGVELEIQQLESRAVMQATGEGEFDLLLWRYGWNGPDALNIFLSSSRIGRTNRVGYSNPEVDALLQEAEHELDQEERLRMYVEAQQIILQESPWHPLYYPLSIIAIRNEVEGARIGYMGRLLLNDITITEEVE